MESWLQPHLEAVLKSRAEVLASWRQQRPTNAGRTKNFEGWLMVELVHHLMQTGYARELLTNGPFVKGKVKASDIA
jgi:hypothetical protein